MDRVMDFWLLASLMSVAGIDGTLNIFELSLLARCGLSCDSLLKFYGGAFQSMAAFVVKINLAFQFLHLSRRKSYKFKFKIKNPISNV